MSEVFESVWFHPAGLDLHALLQRAAREAQVPLSLQELPQHDLAAISIYSRDDAIFDDDRMERVAELISRSADSAMLVRRDTRIPFNATMIFDHGTLTHVFGPADERWVPLDEDDEPITDGPTLGRDELDPDVEYERVLSALDLGFQAFGSGSQEILSEYIYVGNAAVAEP